MWVVVSKMKTKEPEVDVSRRAGERRPDRVVSRVRGLLIRNPAEFPAEGSPDSHARVSTEAKFIGHTVGIQHKREERHMLVRIRRP